MTGGGVLRTGAKSGAVSNRSDVAKDFASDASDKAATVDADAGDPVGDVDATGDSDHATDTHEADAPMSGGSQASSESPKPAGLWGMIREVVIVVSTALVISLLIKTFLFQMFYIPSPSMENTLTEGDRVVASQLTPGLFNLERGDIIVFEDPGTWLPPKSDEDVNPITSGTKTILTFLGVLPRNEGKHLIKRLIGMPGDHVVCCDAEGRVTINDTPLDEPYLAEGAVPSEREFDIVVPEDRVWVMGDNRQNSKDSRWNQDQPANGTVGLSDIVGRATMIAWPINRWTWLSHYHEEYSKIPDESVPADSGS